MQIYRLLGTGLGWFALLTQYWLNMRAAGLLQGSLFYFDYFTIWGNLQVALAFIAPLLPRSSVAAFFERPGVRTAITVYILLVAIIFYILWGGLVVLTGLNWWLNALLHDIMPLLYLLDWLAFVPKQSLSFRQIPVWLILPAVYAIIVMIIGCFTKYYPYGFLNPMLIGYDQATLNILAIGIFIILLSAGLVGFGKLRPTGLLSQ